MDLKSLNHKINRSKKRIEIFNQKAKSKNLENHEFYNYFGGWDVGFEEGKLSVLEDLRDELLENQIDKCSVVELTNYIIDRTHQLTNIELNIMCVLINSYWFVTFGYRLFDDEIKIGKYSPLINNLYDELRTFGASNVDDFIYHWSQDNVEIHDLNEITDWSNLTFDKFHILKIETLKNKKELSSFIDNILDSTHHRELFSIYQSNIEYKKLNRILTDKDLDYFFCIFKSKLFC